MIAPARTLPDAFATTAIPGGPISDGAADALAALLWAAVELQGENQAGAVGQVDQDQGEPGAVGQQGGERP